MKREQKAPPPMWGGRRAKRALWGAIAIACAFALAACSTDAPKKTPTPNIPPQAKTMCGHGSPLNAADKKALCSVLDAANELHWPEDRMATATPAYRVMLFNAAQPITVITMDLPQDAPGKLTVRQLRGTHMIVNTTAKISAAQRKRIHSLAHSTGLWSQALNQDAPTAIGEGRQGFAPCQQSHYIVAEAMKSDHYHLSLAHCAPMKRLEDFAMDVYNIAAADVPALTRELDTTLD